MNAETFCEHFATFADAPNSVEKLRGMILQLAVQGKLVAQCSSEESATVLLETIARRKIDHEGKEDEQGRRRRSAKTSDVQNKQSFPIPRSWEIATIDDLVLNISNGCSQPQTKSTTEFPVTRIETISHGVVNRAKVGFVEALSEDEIQRFRLQDGDILFSHINSEAHLGKTAVFHGTEFLLHGTNLLLIRLPVDLVVPRYFDLLMKYLRVTGYFASIAQHAIHQASINQTKVRSTHVPLAPLAEQRRIVEKVDQLLGLCDELAARQATQREKRQRLVGAALDRLVSTRNPAEFPTHSQRLRNHFDQLFDTPTTIPQLRQTILQLAVQGQLVPQNPSDGTLETALLEHHKEKQRRVNSGELRSSKLPDHAFVAESILHHPNSWMTVSFDHIAVPDNNALKAGPFGSALKKEFYVAKGYKIYGQEQVIAGDPFVGDYYIDQAKFESLESCAVAAGDILISLVGTIGKLLVLPNGIEPGIINPRLIKLTLDQALAFPAFIGLVVGSPYAVQFFKEKSHGGTMSILNLSILRELPIPLPPLAEQKRIVTKVTELLSLCDALEAKLTQAESASTQLLSAAVHHLLQNP